MLSFLIAIPLLIASVTKSVDSGFFLRTLYRLLPIPKILLPIVVLFILATSWFVVAGLILQNCSFFIVPLGIAYLTIATFVTLIRWLLRPSHSCDCYGPGISVHPILSICINLACISALFFVPTTSCLAADLQYNGTLVIIGIILARLSTYTPIWDLSLTAPQKIWKDEAISHKTHIVAYLSPSCDSCSRWLPILISAHRNIPLYIISDEEFVGLPHTITIIRKCVPTPVFEPRLASPPLSNT